MRSAVCICWLIQRAGVWRHDLYHPLRPALRDRVITERGDVRPHVNIFVDGEDIRYAGGLDAPVRDGAEIFLIAAVSGGCGSCRIRPSI